jgi:glyoxylase-like metal-dependent hydrolase (beta-lactamase superfamily II)
MRVHHLNCGTMCPRAGRLVNEERRLVCHCLLVESEGGLVLVDTGFGLGDVADPQGRVGQPLLFLGRPRLDLEECAVRQIARLGLRAEDVRHIVVTHLDLDHAGGLPDFPRAAVHVYATEHGAAMARKTYLERKRYRPQHWAHGTTWVLHETAGERWFGFECVRALEGVGPEVLLVPLFGHTRGHCGVAVRTDTEWLLHAGDAYFYGAEMDPERPRCTPGLRLFQWSVEIDRKARLANQERLRELVRAHAAEVRVLSAHDPGEYRDLGDRGA